MYKSGSFAEHAGPLFSPHQVASPSGFSCYGLTRSDYHLILKARADLHCLGQFEADIPAEDDFDSQHIVSLLIDQ